LPTTMTISSSGDEAQSHDWSAYYDDSGQLYYYNAVTEESSWTAPAEGFHPAPPPEGTDPVVDYTSSQSQQAVVVDAQDETQEGGSTPTPMSPVGGGSEPESDDTVSSDEDSSQGGADDAASSSNAGQGDHDAAVDELPVAATVTYSSGWVAYHDDEGREYYYNAETGATQWEKPDDEVLDQAHTAEKDSDEAIEYELTRVETTPPQSPFIEEEPERVPTPEPEIDPKVKRLQDAEAALNLPDSILELGCIDNVNILLQELGGSEGGQKAMQSLVNNFQGQTAICGLLCQWLTEMKVPDESEDALEEAADDIRESVQEVINKIAKERFNKAVGDSIFRLKKAEAVFLDEMMESERWRKLLIDLSASNKDSTLLKFCLKSISNRGHHREIIKRINPSDHFAVFNAMLASEFAVVGKIAFGSTSDLDTALGMSELVEDLRRTCTSTAYTYIYAIEVLRYLIEEASHLSDQGQMREAIRKWERIQEELENAMMDPSVSSTTAGSSSLFRKRRLDIALTISELQQQQRRRLDPTVSNVDRHDNERHHNSLETAVLGLLRKSAMGTQLDDNNLDQLLPKNGSDGGEVGKLLISHPLAIKALLGHLFKPGSTRVLSLLTRAKCAHLIALAVMAAEKVSNEYSGKGSLVGITDKKAHEEEIKGMLLTGSQMCELVENMVSFTVSSKIEENNASAGMKLCALALKSAPVAQGVISWSLEVVRGSDFVTSASYPTLSPCILGLVRIIASKHPFTRRTAMDVALTFLGHTNSEISSQKMNSLKEQSLRLLIILLCKGEATSVFGSIAALLNAQGTSVIDSSLLRYFVSGLLDVVMPPFSLVMIRSMGAMLSTKPCIEAVRSTFFGDVNQARLNSIVDRFRESVQNDEALKANANDKKLVSLLVASYC